MQELLACARPSWRTTDLKKRGVKFEDLCHSEPGNVSLKLSAPEAASAGAEQ